MPYLKKKMTLRRPMRRLRRRLPLRRRVLPRRQNVHTFKRSVYVPAWVSTLAVGDTSFKLEPSLADLPNYTEWTSLYDRFKISGISFKLIPRINVAAVGTSAPPSQIFTCLDYDGNGATTLSAIQQYQNLRMTRGMTTHKRYFKPAVLAMAYESGTSTAYTPKWNQYIDSVNPTTPHYGLYGVIPNCSGAVIPYDLEATYYISCKNVR